MKIFLSILLIYAQVQSFDIFANEGNINQFLKSGGQFGYFYNTEFWNWLEQVRHTGNNSKYLTAPFKYGTSFQKRPLNGFYITADTTKIEQELPKKNLLLFTALHHSREPLTLTMVMLMVIEILKNLQSDQHNRFHELIRDNVIVFLPVVNVDSYVFINKHWNNQRIGKQAMMIRKNRNIEGYCDQFTGGVDLNRNYSFKFALDESGSSSDPCSEDFRGRSPFSEPETKAIKNFVESHPNIVSGVNIHSYGNDWIYPFNYVHDGSNSLLKRTKRLYYDFYNEFKNDIKKQDPDSVFGNAAFTLDYATNGEAGDWLTGAENILNIDIELGNKDRKSNSFYPPRRLIDKIVRFNWITMKEFLFRHIIDFKLRRVIFHKNKKSVDFFIMNKALSGLNEFNAGFELKFKNNYKSQKPFQLMYTIEELPNYKKKLQRVNKDIVSVKFPGRHILLLRVSFSSQDDFDNFQDLTMIVERDDHFRNYPEQEFTFKTAQYKKIQLKF